MEDNKLFELFERFKSEVLTNVPSEAEKEAIANAFIVTLSKS